MVKNTQRNELDQAARVGVTVNPSHLTDGDPVFWTDPATGATWVGVVTSATQDEVLYASLLSPTGEHRLLPLRHDPAYGVTTPLDPDGAGWVAVALLRLDDVTPEPGASLVPVPRSVLVALVAEDGPLLRAVVDQHTEDPHVAAVCDALGYERSDGSLPAYGDLLTRQPPPGA